MNIKKTRKGLGLISFIDNNGVSCSLQESLCGVNIWFGCDDPNPRMFEQGEGWIPMNLPNNVQCTTRMHLNQEQVKELLPHLQRFAEKGCI